MLCAVPETGSSDAYSGRAPMAVKADALAGAVEAGVEVACWPSASGPTVSASVAMPLALVMAAAAARDVMPPADCQATDWPAAGAPLLSARAWAVQVTVAPAATESAGVSAVRTGAFRR